MQRAGIPQDVILSKIRNSTTDFQTTPQDLVELKQAGVDNAVIQAMVKASDR